MSLLNNLIGRLKAIFRRAPPSGDFADLSVDEVVGSMLQAMGGITLDAYVDGDYLAGVWLLDRVWSKDQSVLPSALIFYSRGYCKKLDRFRTDQGGYDTAVSGFSYGIEGDRLISCRWMNRKRSTNRTRRLRTRLKRQRTGNSRRAASGFSTKNGSRSGRRPWRN